MFLFAAFQIITVYSINVNEVPFITFLLVLIVTFIFNTIVFYIFTILTKKRNTSAICYNNYDWCIIYFQK